MRSHALSQAEPAAAREKRPCWPATQIELQRERKVDRSMREALLLGEAIEHARRAQQPCRVMQELLNIQRYLDALIGIPGLRAGICGLRNTRRLIEATVDFLEAGFDGGFSDGGVHWGLPV